MLKELTLTEFKERFPQVSTYGLEDPLNVFLENGEILIEREWNGEEYILKNGKTYRPVYKPLNEDDYTVIGYVEMEKYTRVQVEILLTADEKALLDHYVKENNQRYRKRGATRNCWTLEKLLQCLLSDITYQAVKHRSVRTVWQKLS